MIANELRIGNYVLTNKFADNEDDGVLLQVNGIGLDVDFTNGCTQNYIGINGVPLTKKWLDNFEKTEYNAFWANLSKDVDGHFVWVSGFKVYIKHVHNLQNLYFALTNEELTRVDGF